MIKKILLFCLLLFTFAHTGFAHTGLETSYPQDGEVVKEQVQEIVLNFETKVEQGSTFDLTTADGLAIPLSTILLNENQMKATVQQPLENGEFLVHWDIIGADGHPIQGEFSFVVEMEQAEDTTEDTTEEPNEEEQEPKDQTSANPPTSAELPETDEQQQSFTISILIIILVIMSLISVGTFIIIFKRKN